MILLPSPRILEETIQSLVLSMPNHVGVMTKPSSFKNTVFWMPLIWIKSSKDEDIAAEDHGLHICLCVWNCIRTQITTSVTNQLMRASLVLRPIGKKSPDSGLRVDDSPSSWGNCIRCSIFLFLLPPAVRKKEATKTGESVGPSTPPIGQMLKEGLLSLFYGQVQRQQTVMNGMTAGNPDLSFFSTKHRSSPSRFFERPHWPRAWKSPLLCLTSVYELIQVLCVIHSGKVW